MFISLEAKEMDEEESLCIKCNKRPCVLFCFWCQRCIDEEKFVEESLEDRDDRITHEKRNGDY